MTGPRVTPDLGRNIARREMEVLVGIGDGETITEIAARLGISVKTVSTYRTRLLDKLQLRTTGHLVRYAIRNGLVAL